MIEGAATGYAIRAASLAEPPQAARDVEVPAQLAQLGHSIQQLQAMALELIERLKPVSQMAPPPGGPERPNAVHPVRCPVAEQISSYRETVDGIGQLLNAARNRLEI